MIISARIIYLKVSHTVDQVIHKFKQTDAQQRAFDIIKKKLIEKPILVYPNWNKLFKLYTNVSDIGLGIILIQDNDNRKEKVIAYEAKL